MSATATSVSCSAVWSLTAQNARSGVSRAVPTYSSNVKPSVRRKVSCFASRGSRDSTQPTRDATNVWPSARASRYTSGGSCLTAIHGARTVPGCSRFTL